MAELTPEMKRWLKACGWEYHGKPKTNADRIRAMSDEELADMIADGCCRNIDCPDEFAMPDGLNCSGCWLDWLRSPANGGDVDA